jgi:hypothetical protein
MVEYEPAEDLPDPAMPKTLDEFVKFCQRWLEFTQTDAAKQVSGTIFNRLLKDLDKTAMDLVIRYGLSLREDAITYGIGSNPEVVALEFIRWRQWALDAISKQPRHEDDIVWETSTAVMSAKEIAEKFGMKYNALDARLRRLRESDSSCWESVENPSVRKPHYRYILGKVWPHIRDLRA